MRTITAIMAAMATGFLLSASSCPAKKADTVPAVTAEEATTEVETSAAETDKPLTEPTEEPAVKPAQASDGEELLWPAPPPGLTEKITAPEDVPAGVQTAESLANAAMQPDSRPVRRYYSTLRFDTETWRFGAIEEAAGPVSHTFTFVNTGDEPVVIEHVSTSCGCTTPEYSRKPVMPGEKGEFKVTFDPEYRPGPFSKDVHIISGGGENRNVLTVTGTVNPKPRPVEEGYPFIVSSGIRLNTLHVNIGNVWQGKPVSAVVGYANISDMEVGLSAQAVPVDGLLAVTVPDKVCPGCQGDITVTALIPEGGMYGRFSYRVYPVINGVRQLMAVNVTGTATDNFAKMPLAEAPQAQFSEVFHRFDGAAPGDILTHAFTLANDGQGTLIVRNVETRDGISTSLKTGTKIAPGKSRTFEVTLDASGADPGIFSQVVTLVLNDPRQPVREIRLAAEILDR